MSTDKIFSNYSLDLLNQNHPYYELKIENYKACLQNYENGSSFLTHYPLRATLQTNETCNLKCVMCQIHGHKIQRKLLTLSYENLKKNNSKIISLSYRSASNKYWRTFTL